jgi:hypothetical protein
MVGDMGKNGGSGNRFDGKTIYCNDSRTDYSQTSNFRSSAVKSE